MVPAASGLRRGAHAADRRPRASPLPAAGFIGSHTALCLVENGYTITVLDNLDNSFQLAIDRVSELAGDKAGQMKFVKGDLRSFEDMDKLFAAEK